MINANEKIAENFWTNFGVCLLINKDLGSNKPPENVRVEEENDVKYGMGIEVYKAIWGWTYSNKGRADFSSCIAFRHSSQPEPAGVQCQAAFSGATTIFKWL